MENRRKPLDCGQLWMNFITHRDGSNINQIEEIALHNVQNTQILTEKDSSCVGMMKQLFKYVGTFELECNIELVDARTKAIIDVQMKIK